MLEEKAKVNYILFNMKDKIIANSTSRLYQALMITITNKLVLSILFSPVSTSVVASSMINNIVNKTIVNKTIL